MLEPVPRGESLVARTAQMLREALRRGEFPGEMPGERTLSEGLGVSRPVVRAALAQLTREGSVAAARGRRRRVALAGAEREAGLAERVVMLSPVAAGEMPPFITLWVDELRERLAAAGVPLELRVRPGAYAARPGRALRALAGRHPGAVWLLYLASAAMQRWFQASGLPCVLAGTCVEGVALPAVDTDHRAASRHAGGMLLKAGRRRLALLLPKDAMGGDRESEAGFVEVIGRSALKPEGRVIRHDGTVRGLRRELDRLLAVRPAVDGLVVARSHHVLTVLTHLLERGVRVPEEMALMSLDDDAFLRHAVPGVARYACDPVKFAAQLHRITRQLLEEGVSRARPRLLVPQWVRGETLP